MWNYRYSNRICNNQAKIREQLRHLEALLSTKPIIEDTEPFKPGFLKLSIKSPKTMQIKKEKIKHENKKHKDAVYDIQTKPSIYNQYYLSPGKYPAFNKRNKSYNYDKKVKQKEIKKQNYVMKQRISTIRGEYDNDKLIKRDRQIRKYKTFK